jgi:hypothetical protein
MLARTDSFRQATPRTAKLPFRRTRTWSSAFIMHPRGHRSHVRHVTRPYMVYSSPFQHILAGYAPYGLIQTGYPLLQLVPTCYPLCGHIQTSSPSSGLVSGSQYLLCISEVTGHAYGHDITIYSSLQLVWTHTARLKLVPTRRPSDGLVFNSQHLVCIGEVTGHTYGHAITINGFILAATIALHSHSVRSSSILTFIT